MKFFKSEDYQPRANELYEKIKAELLIKIPHARLEHIGASSIPGCISKGDLDIFVGVDSSQFDISTNELCQLGFIIKEGSFRNNELCPFEGVGYNLDVGIQLVVNGSEFEFFIKFRDILRSNESILYEYNNLKNNSRNLSPDEYRAIKSKFIDKILSNSTSV